MMQNRELLEKAKAAGSPEELLALAKENNYPLSEEDAKAYFEKMHKSGELSDDELDNVSGGCGGSFRICPRCEYPLEKVSDGWRCRSCGYTSK